ncbi:MAG: hypothetical protein BWY37_02160 [Firmicutes bacterium ADurb.Bin262]|nr:MAG: hypothetical protein BWY37_02160 [Firmicutes bacterium ADurb.Bin262]
MDVPLPSVPIKPPTPMLLGDVTFTDAVSVTSPEAKACSRVPPVVIPTRPPIPDTAGAVVVIAAVTSPVAKQLEIEAPELPMRPPTILLPLTGTADLLSLLTMPMVRPTRPPTVSLPVTKLALTPGSPLA